MVEEIWKDITNYEGIYEVSNLGNVRTHINKTTHSIRHGTRHWKQRVLKQKTDKCGYKRVSLWKDNKDMTHLVHRLVATEFVYNHDEVNYVIINHIDCNTSNNIYSNLEWCDYTKNLEHAFENRLNKSAKITTLINRETKEKHVFISMAKASLFIGRDKRYISTILKNGQTYSDGYDILVDWSI